jgi:pimeloyl-ACP methyl ester carboxylesterase
MNSRIMTRRRWLKVTAQVGSAGMLALSLPGCGGSSDGETTPSEIPPPAPAPAPTIVTTPASRFSMLADFPYGENYAAIAGMRMHYVDAGPRDAQHTFLCLHGQPTWSYLYRKMIPVFTAAGHRVVAPDWFGFGKSDKPLADSSYTFTFHRKSMLDFIGQLDLRNVTLVVQDWGGLLGLTLPPAMPERFARLIIMNTTFATGEPLDPSQTDWAVLSQQRRDRWLAMTDVDVQRIILSASPTATPTIAAAYDAPFPDPSYEAGARRFPVIVPITPDEEGADISREAMAWWSAQWSGRTFMAVGAQDQLLGPEVMNIMKTRIRNCPEPMVIAGAGHFVQEDAGAEVAEAALRAFG